MLSVAGMLARGLRTGRILVMADDVEIIERVTSYFAALDYEAHGARRIEEAIRVLDAVKPDVVLLDVPMPRLPDVLVHLRGHSPGLPILVATETADGARRLRALGVFACVRRPFIWEVLRYRVALAVEAALRSRSNPQPA